VSQDVREYVRRGCSDRATRDLLLTALSDPNVNAKATRKGLFLGGPNGSVTAHFTASDKRSALNLRAQLRRAGVTTP
jgi:hypothetical protein